MWIAPIIQVILWIAPIIQNVDVVPPQMDDVAEEVLQRFDDPDDHDDTIDTDSTGKKPLQG